MKTTIKNKSFVRDLHITISNEETFHQDFLVILKQMLQDFTKAADKYLLVNEKHYTMSLLY